MARILAVDDSAAMRQMVGITLTGAGHDVQQASDGAEALQLAERQKFDLVITDVNMPKMDGITLVRELRSRASYRYACSASRSLSLSWARDRFSTIISSSDLISSSA